MLNHLVGNLDGLFRCLNPSVNIKHVYLSVQLYEVEFSRFILEYLNQVSHVAAS